jgi:hypothetical protein
VNIIYDWQHSADVFDLSGEGMKAIFYPDNGAYKGLESQTSYEGFVGTLEACTYRFLAYTADSKNISFQNDKVYELATANAVVQEVDNSNPAQPDTLLLPAEAAYSASSNLLDITDGMVIRHVPVLNISGNVYIKIINHTGHELRSAFGRMRGLVRTRKLAGGESIFAMGTGASDFSGDFATTAVNVLPEVNATIPCLGVFNPDPTGTGHYRYYGTMDLYITESDGTVHRARNVDLSEAISQLIPDGYDSSLSLILTLTINSLDDIQVDVAINDWTNGGDLPPINVR